MIKVDNTFLPIPGYDGYFLSAALDSLYQKVGEQYLLVKGTKTYSKTIYYKIMVGDQLKGVLLRTLAKIVSPPIDMEELTPIPHAPGYFIHLPTEEVYSNVKGYIKKHKVVIKQGGIKSYYMRYSGKRTYVTLGRILSTIYPEDIPIDLIRLEEYPDYYVNKLGELFSKKITFNNSFGKLRKCGSIDHEGYLAHTFWSNGKGRKHRVHEIIARVFLGPRPNGAEGAHIRHLNGDKLDNRVENLAYGSWKDNAMDNVLLGAPSLHPGELHKDAKLTNKDVLEARERYKNGEKIVSLAEGYGVHSSAMSRAVRKISWRTV